MLSRTQMTQSDATIRCWKYSMGKNSFPPLSAEKFRQKKFNGRIQRAPTLHPVTLQRHIRPASLKNCCYNTLFFFIFLNLCCVYKKWLPLWTLNKALLLHPCLSMTMTWFPWDFYGNWLNLCNLIKVLGSKQRENENSECSCGWNGGKWRTLFRLA